MNLRISINVLSLFLLISSFFMMSCLIPAYTLKDPPKAKIFFSIFPIVTFIVSLCIFVKTRITTNSLSLKVSFIIVSFSWVGISLFGAIPYVLILDLSFTNAFFEAMSGLTTTGASILSNIEALPYSLLYWRSLTNWLGGMGIIVLFLAIFPFFNFGSSNIYKAEVPGPNSDKLTSRITQTAKILWLVYILLTLLLFFLLKLCGMNFFDAICHAFSTMATGGFSTKNTSLAYFDPIIHSIITIFMFIAGCNFIWHINLLKGKFSNYFKNEEFLYFFFISIGAIILVTISLYHQGEYSRGFWNTLNTSSFQVISLMTTTGFTTENFNLWPSLAIFVLIILCFFGACGGSTSGGLKLSRIIIVLKQSLLQLKNSVRPHYIFPVLFNKKNITQGQIAKLYAFISLYFITFCFGTLIILILNKESSFVTAMSASIACLSNIGPGLDQVGPQENFLWFSNSTKWFMSFLMLIGRLEFYTVLVLFSSDLWKRR